MVLSYLKYICVSWKVFAAFRGKRRKSVISIFLILIFGLFLPYRAVFGKMTTYESSVNQIASKIEFIGETAGEQLGAAIVGGDFNNDGVDDIAMGSPFSSIGDREWNGKVTIVFGKNSWKNKKIDLANVFPDVTFFGEYSGDQFGTTLTSGDFNRDGIADIAIGAYNAFSDGERPGKVYVVLGQSTWSRQSYDFLIAKPDIEFVGNKNDEGFGLALSTVDIDDDNRDDLLIGSPFSSYDDVKKSGMVYAFLAKKEWMSTGVYASDQADMIFYGLAPNERFGSAIAAGTIISKKLIDVAIGAYSADDGDKTQVGKVYIYKGRDNFLKNFRKPTLTFTGSNQGEWLGYALAAGDTNGDGKDDLAISSFPYNSHPSLGKVTIFYGKQDLEKKASVIYPSDKNANIIIKKSLGEALMGASVLLPDFNGDNQKEIVLGAPGVGDPLSSDAGDVYILFNDNPGRNIVYSARDGSVTSTIHGENADDWFGFSLADLDFNGDGYTDLAVGSRYSDGKKISNNGKVFILPGVGNPYGNGRTVNSPEDVPISRGELIHEVIDRLDLKTKKAEFIESCYEHKDFCLFNFMAISLYNDVRLDPTPVLYPDVPEDYEYYEDVVVGTMLGLVNGMTTEKDNPFHPDDPISRINALKIVLGAADLVPPLYRFELKNQLGSYENLALQPSYFGDVNPQISSMWWYPRYTNFAVENGIIKQNRIFRPDDKITVSEFNSMLNNTIKYLRARDKETEKIEP